VWIFFIFEYLAVFNPRVVSLLPLVSGRVNELILNDPERDIGLIERDFRHFASVSEVCIDSLCHIRCLSLTESLSVHIHLLLRKMKTF
jgi:hypothetical protein